MIVPGNGCLSRDCVSLARDHSAIDAHGTLQVRNRFGFGSGNDDDEKCWFSRWF